MQKIWFKVFLKIFSCLLWQFYLHLVILVIFCFLEVFWYDQYFVDFNLIFSLSNLLHTFSVVGVFQQSLLYCFTHLKVVYTSVNWWFLTGLWVTASLFKSPGLFLVFCPISIMPQFGLSPLVLLFPKKLMKMHKALHPRDDTDRLYVSKKEGRGRVSIQDSVDASIQWHKDYINKRRGRLITTIRNNTNNTSINVT